MPALSPCRAARASAVFATVWFAAALATAGSARADDPAPTPTPALSPAAAQPPGPPEAVFSGTHFGVGSSFGGDSPVAFLAGNTNAVLWGLGLVFAHDENLMADKTHAAAVLSLGYMVHNKFPFAMGPEIDITPDLAPKAFDGIDVRAGWALWYAPWNIPAVVGTAVFVDLNFPSGGKSVITTLTPAVRVVFGFH